MTALLLLYECIILYVKKLTSMQRQLIDYQILIYTLNYLLFAEKQIIKLTYDEKVQLTAYWKQISSGPYDPEKYPDVGYFDVIGSDRR